MGGEDYPPRIAFTNSRRGFLCEIVYLFTVASRFLTASNSSSRGGLAENTLRRGEVSVTSHFPRRTRASSDRPNVPGGWA
jgi:hypothetical protein